MFLGRKQYLESIGKISCTDVDVQIKGKKIKFLINQENLVSFNELKSHIEKESSSCLFEKEDFAPEQILVQIIFNLLNNKNTQQETLVQQNVTTQEEYFTKHEATEACIVLLRNILND